MIRPFEERDAEAVATMVAALNTEERYARQHAAKAAQLCEAYLGALLAAGEPPCGYRTLHPFFETEYGARGGCMGDLYVAPAARRQGLGRALVAGAARHVRAAWGGEFLWWTALPRNARVHAFYAALGAGGEPVRAFALTRHAFDRLAERP